MESRTRTLDYLPVDELPDDPRNPKGHADADIAASIVRFGFNEPIVIDERTGLLLSGHGRKGVLLDGQKHGGLPDPGDPDGPLLVPDGIMVDEGGRWHAPVVRGVESANDDEAAAMLIAFNHLVEKGGWTNEGRELAGLLASLNDGPGLAGTGFDANGLDALLASLSPPEAALPEIRGRQSQAARNLAQRFGAPPFSVLDGRQGYWRDRKRDWVDLGIRSEEGRPLNVLAHSGQEGPEDGRRHRNASMSMSYTGADPSFYNKKRAAEEALGRELDTVEFIEMFRDQLNPIAATSIFDPVLAEIAYRWWSPPGGLVLDPFAGGSVRGIVAAWTGRDYLGIDLRPEQVEANRRQWEDISAAALGDTAGADDERPALTPVEEHGGHLVKRDDRFAIAGWRGGKVRTCWALASRPGVTGLVTAGALQSPQVGIVAAVARRLGLPCRVHVPAGTLSPDLRAAAADGAELVRHFPGHNSVIVAAARKDAAARGWLEIPFGMECDEAPEQTAGQVENLPDGIARIVMPVGSGMSLAGVVRGLRRAGRDGVRILGVVVGASPVARLDEYAPGWRDVVDLVDAGVDYHSHAASSLLGSLALDPVYEAKCLPFLQRGDLLWVVGIRRGSVGAAADVGEARWHTGDSRDMTADLLGRPADFLFSCPPYYDLEQYSDDPLDLSNAGTYDEFRAAYREIIAKGCALLADDRFACFVVGEVRGSAGGRSKSGATGFVGLVPDTIAAFRDAGLAFHNDAVYITPAGSIPVRAAGIFKPNRRLAKTHQNVLVFVKGDPGRAAEAIGPAEAVADDLDGDDGPGYGA